MSTTNQRNGKTPPAEATEPSNRQARFLAQHIVLEEGGIPGFVRTVTVTVGLIVAAFFIWSAVTTVDEVAAAPGEVKPSGHVQAVQHLEGGIVEEILISDGDFVKAGETLVRLDPDSVLSHLRGMQMQTQRAGLRLKAERLRAFSDERQPDFTFIEPEYAGLAADQLAIFRIQDKARSNRRAVLNDQIHTAEAQVSLLEGQEKTHQRIVELTTEELAMSKKLMKKGLTSKLKVLNLQRELTKASGDFDRLRGELLLAERAKSEAESRLAELDATLGEEAFSELDSLTRELAKLNDAINGLEDQEQRLDITAPVSGIIKGLQVHTVGGVIPPGAVVLEIVPMDREMVVEARISSRDVGHVRPGQPVTVKVGTYDYARYGGVPGALTGVSASTFIGEDGAPYYKGFVELERGYVGANPKRNHVLPGMTINADIKTGSKTVLQYLLKPLYASVDGSFHER